MYDLLLKLLLFEYNEAWLGIVICTNSTLMLMKILNIINRVQYIISNNLILDNSELINMFLMF